MSDFPTAPLSSSPPNLEIVSQFWRTLFAASGFVFGLGLIAYLTAHGTPENSLHQSALSWGFMLVGAIPGGVCFLALLPFLPTKK